MESFIKDHVMNYLTESVFINLVSCKECIRLYHLDEGYSVKMIYLDFQTAFDSIHIQRLIHKLASTAWLTRKCTT